MKYRIVPLEQRSKEWLQFREGKIGASMVGSIMEVDPYRTKLELWEEIVLGSQVQVTPAMQRGIDKEPETLAAVNQSEIISYAPAVLQSQEYPWMIASLDGFRQIADANLVTHSVNYIVDVVEIKWTNQKNHDLAKEGKVPPQYYPQLQFQLYISGAPRVKYISCHAEGKISILVERDESYIQKMVDEVLHFKQSLVDFKAPLPSERDTITITDPDLTKSAFRYKELDLLIKELSQEKEMIRDELICSASHPKLKLGPLNISKVIRKGNIDYKSIPQLKEIDLELYRKEPVISWVFNPEESE